MKEGEKRKQEKKKKYPVLEVAENFILLRTLLDSAETPDGAGLSLLSTERRKMMIDVFSPFIEVCLLSDCLPCNHLGPID